ncbi:MAG: TatD family hydrolase [Candidatus Heimdallarchaeaceae archaeon]
MATAMDTKKQSQELVCADAHCHLCPPWFKSSDIEQVVNRAKENNIQTIINSVIEPKVYDFGLNTTLFPEIHLSLGLEPTRVNEEWFERFKQFFIEHKDKIVAIGEIGLDYHWVKDVKEQQIQRDYFYKLIEFAKKNRKPIVIHSRKAEEDAISILQSYKTKEVLMHCFSGDEKQIKQIVDEGWYISVPTSLVYRRNYQKILKSIPLENLMLETDSPFHSLEKGKNNEPKYIAIAIKHAAKHLDVKNGELATVTTKNVKSFYHLE